MLRAELTAFGHPPGPITQTTKKLYIKRLIKYKRNTTTIQEMLENDKKLENSKYNFSIESKVLKIRLKTLGVYKKLQNISD